MVENEIISNFAAEMKKALIIMIYTIAVLMGTAMVLGNPTLSGIYLGDSTIPTDAQKEADSHLTINHSIQKDNSIDPQELNYYLERHNVQDEGYEMVVAFANGQRHHVEIDKPITVWNIGSWKDHIQEGAGIVLDSLGRSIVGNWETDSLTTGIRPDSVGTYIGDFSGLKAEGHGAYVLPDGSYFEGHWDNDMREGFGLELLQHGKNEQQLRVGEWNKNRFMGERMKYTTERIYGIDIARYQHGKGRKKYNINWNQMRITYLGRRGQKNVSGTSDYPVSFVFIKSTEGITIRNPYYASDYLKARQHNIHIGAYHFFSVRTTGSAQANYFLRNTMFKDGDLPPVLDVEPSDAQIQQMGGIDNLFSHIRTWLKIVESKVGVKPILYVNQRFVNLYLSQAPDIKHDYRIWIARYSEYKPDVHLAFWQLCPDGKVAGITGDVDINVFNGYKSAFEEFLENETIKH